MPACSRVVSVALCPSVWRYVPGPRFVLRAGEVRTWIGEGMGWGVGSCPMDGWGFNLTAGREKAGKVGHGKGGG